MSDISEARRSSRQHNVAKADAETLTLSNKAKTNSSKSYRERKPDEQRFASEETRANAMERAEKLRSSLECPSFIRSMVRSHVYTCYWLGIPREFCNDHLPRDDQEIILENEMGEDHVTKFLSRRTGLSGGWRGFALKNKLHDGDAVVFELIKLARFKVYIVRAHHPKEENDAVVTESLEEQKMEQSENSVELEAAENSVELEAAPKPQPTKRNRRKPTRPMKSDDGVSKSQSISVETVDEEDDTGELILNDDTDDLILNGGAATINLGDGAVVAKRSRKQGSPKKFRRRSVTQTKLFRKRRTWA